MAEKKERVYAALVEGATSGLEDGDLFNFVLKRCPDTPSRRIVRASLLALSDPELRDGKVLNVIYALAIKHRLDELGEGSRYFIPLENAPAKKTAVKKRKKAVSLPVPEKKKGPAARA